MKASIKKESISQIWDTYYDKELSNQEITSASTARLQRPRTLKVMREANLIEQGNILLDVGCGSGNKYFKEENIDMGFDYNGCDPFNQSKEKNLESIEKCMNSNSNIVTLNNVLNTIKEKDVRLSILSQCENALNEENGVLLILIYEGSKTVSEKRIELETMIKLKELSPLKTRDGWQNRSPISSYLSEVEQVFDFVKLISVNGVKLIVAAKNENIKLDLKEKIKEMKK